MPQGLQIYNPNGEVILDLTYRVMKILTVAMVNGSSGSVAFPTGSYSVASVAVAGSDADRLKAVPRVTIGSGSASWDYGSVGSDDRANTRVMVSAY